MISTIKIFFFSSPSFWKGVTTQLRAQGASDADIRNRGNYVVASEVPRLTYDYSCAGHKPLSSNSLLGGHKLEIADIKRHLPNWNQRTAAHLGYLGSPCHYKDFQPSRSEVQGGERATTWHAQHTQFLVIEQIVLY